MWQQLPWLTFRPWCVARPGRPGQSHNKLRTQLGQTRRAGPRYTCLGCRAPTDRHAILPPPQLGTSTDTAKPHLFCLFYVATLCVSIFDPFDTCNYTTFLLSLTTLQDRRNLIWDFKCTLLSSPSLSKPNEKLKNFQQKKNSQEKGKHWEKGGGFLLSACRGQPLLKLPQDCVQNPVQGEVQKTNRKN